jgi:hypothetical protein
MAGACAAHPERFIRAIPGHPRGLAAGHPGQCWELAVW